MYKFLACFLWQIWSPELKAKEEGSRVENWEQRTEPAVIEMDQ